MGKVGSYSWLTAVKKPFRSPSKDSEKKSCRRRDENYGEDDERKSEKRRWLFRKSSSTQEVVKAPVVVVADQRHAMDVAVATEAAAEAAVASAQAVVEVVRLSKPSTDLLREHHAAVRIQTSFRGFLARRALRALKGLVKLQALVRGHNVRKQANMTLRCMQALVRLQSRARDQRCLRLSQESASAITNCSWDSRFLQESFTDRKSLSREETQESCHTDQDLDERPHAIEEIQVRLLSRKDASVKREKALAYAFSHQLWRSSGRSSNPSTFEETDDERASAVSSTVWLDRWMATRPSEIRSRASVDQCRDYIKNVEVDTARHCPTAASVVESWQRSRRPPASGSGAAAHNFSPTQQRALQLLALHPPSTPSPAKARPLKYVRSASPRLSRAREEDRRFLSYTPASYCRHSQHQDGAGGAVPNYMAATESTKARVRSQSAPRQRPNTPERERLSSVKKRLSYPVPPDMQTLRIPSLKGAPSRLGSHYPSSSNYSWCTDSVACGEISPSSAGDFRRWLR